MCNCFDSIKRSSFLSLLIIGTLLTFCSALRRDCYHKNISPGIAMLGSNIRKQIFSQTKATLFCKHLTNTYSTFAAVIINYGYYWSPIFLLSRWVANLLIPWWYIMISVYPTKRLTELRIDFAYTFTTCTKLYIWFHKILTMLTKNKNAIASPVFLSFVNVTKIVCCFLWQISLYILEIINIIIFNKFLWTPFGIISQKLVI